MAHHLCRGASFFSASGSSGIRWAGSVLLELAPLRFGVSIVAEPEGTNKTQNQASACPEWVIQSACPNRQNASSTRGEVGQRAQRPGGLCAQSGEKSGSLLTWLVVLRSAFRRVGNGRRQPCVVVVDGLVRAEMRTRTHPLCPTAAPAPRRLSPSKITQRN